MTLDEIIDKVKILKSTSISARRFGLIYDDLIAYKKERESIKVVPDPEAEWVTLESDEASFGFQKCCESFLSELQDGISFKAYDHPSGKRPLIGTAARISGYWEIYYCPYCGVKINLQYELPY